MHNANFFFNGCSSAGKGFICKKLREMYSQPLVSLGIDYLWKAMADKYMIRDGKNLSTRIVEGMGFYKKDGKIMDCTGIIGEQLMVTYLKMLESIYKNGMCFLADYVIEYEGFLFRIASEFANIRVYFIKVCCNLKELERREIERKDRFIGTARNHFETIYNLRFLEHDYVINSDTDNIEDAINNLIQYTKLNPPVAFKNIFKNYKNNNIAVSRFNKNYEIKNNINDIHKDNNSFNNYIESN